MKLLWEIPVWFWAEFIYPAWIAVFPGKSCQLPCDAACEGGKRHCWNRHRPRNSRDWHDPAVCDAKVGEARRWLRLS